MERAVKPNDDIIVWWCSLYSPLQTIVNDRQKVPPLHSTRKTKPSRTVTSTSHTSSHPTWSYGSAVVEHDQNKSFWCDIDGEKKEIRCSILLVDFSPRSLPRKLPISVPAIGGSIFVFIFPIRFSFPTLDTIRWKDSRRIRKCLEDDVV